jgi:hypothetical protein
VEEHRLRELIENEREWRRYIVEQIESMKHDVGMLKAWGLAFRLAGVGAVTFLWIWIEHKLKT